MWLTMSMWEACRLLHALITVEEEDLTVTEKALMNALIPPVRKHLYGADADQIVGTLSELYDELLEYE